MGYNGVAEVPLSDSQACPHVVVNFEQIWIAFDRVGRSSDPADESEIADRSITAGRAGWNAAGATENWTEAEELAMRQYVDVELTPDVLAVHGNGAKRWAEFSCY